jgi:hypothetical protein
LSRSQRPGSPVYHSGEPERQQLRFLRARYPEFAGSSDRLLESLSGFNALATLFAGARGNAAIEGDWTMYSQGARGFLTRLARDRGYRDRFASLVATESQQLIEVAPDFLDRGCWKPGPMWSDSVDILLRADTRG